MADLDKWWSCLTVAEKERIATKVAKTDVAYPECSEYWNSFSVEKKKAIYDHVTDRHGHVLKEWSEGINFSY